MILQAWTIASNGDHVRLGAGSDVAVLRVSPQDDGTYRARMIGEDSVLFTDLGDAREQLDAHALHAGFAFDAPVSPSWQAVLDAADRYTAELMAHPFTDSRYPEWAGIRRLIARHHVNTLRSPP